jgi:hypothetical protein
MMTHEAHGNAFHSGRVGGLNPGDGVFEHDAAKRGQV